MTHEENQYLDLIRTTLETATQRTTRNGAVTLATFGNKMTFSLRDNVIPLLTTKRVFFRGIVEELLWVIRGSTNASDLAERNVRIWDGHTSREHLDSCGHSGYEVGDTGPLYGFQWRHSGANYEGMRADYTGKGVDQLVNVIESLRNDPYGRRHVVSAWVPHDLSKMALSPCHCLFQFFVEDDGHLSCMLYQRSGDIGLGVPFNIASYSILARLVAIAIGRPAGKFIHVLGDAHVYAEHIGALEKQVTKDPYPFPTMTVSAVPIDITDMSAKDVVKWMEELTFDRFHLVDYKHHETQKMKMVV